MCERGLSPADDNTSFIKVIGLNQFCHLQSKSLIPHVQLDTIDDMRVHDCIYCMTRCFLKCISYTQYMKNTLKYYFMKTIKNTDALSTIRLANSLTSHSIATISAQLLIVNLIRCKPSAGVSDWSILPPCVH